MSAKIKMKASDEIAKLKSRPFSKRIYTGNCASTILSLISLFFPNASSRDVILSHGVSASYGLQAIEDLLASASDFCYCIFVDGLSSVNVVLYNCVKEGDGSTIILSFLD